MNQTEETAHDRRTGLGAKYRKHARNLREAASFDNRGLTAEALNSIADEYENMARALEGVDSTNKEVHARLNRDTNPEVG